MTGRHSRGEDYARVLCCCVEAWIFSLLGVWLLIVACTLIFLSGGDE